MEAGKRSAADADDHAAVHEVGGGLGGTVLWAPSVGFHTTGPISRDATTAPRRSTP
jgi:hypothetical protein